MNHRKAMFFPTGPLLILCATFASTIFAASPPTFRVVYNMTGGYDQPGGVIEGSPGVFYSIAGSGPSIAFSLTSQGSQTILGTFPNPSSFQSLLASGPNGRFYSTIYWGPGNYTSNISRCPPPPTVLRSTPRP